MQGDFRTATEALVRRGHAFGSSFGGEIKIAMVRSAGTGTLFVTSEATLSVTSDQAIRGRFSVAIHDARSVIYECSLFNLEEIGYNESHFDIPDRSAWIDQFITNFNLLFDYLETVSCLCPSIRQGEIAWSILDKKWVSRSVMSPFSYYFVSHCPRCGLRLLPLKLMTQSIQPNFTRFDVVMNY